MLFNFSKVQIRFLANEGIMIYTNKRKVLIDALHRGNDSLAAPVDEDTLEKIVSGSEPFKGADLLLFTHEHADHFDRDLTVRAMNANPALMLVGPRAVTEAVRTSEDLAEEASRRIWTMDMTLGGRSQLHIRDISVEAAGLEHDATGKDCQVNNAYLICVGGKRILHVGDAKAVPESFEGITEDAKGADAMIVPFTYAGIPDARDIIASLAPKKLMITHMPDKTKDTDNWNEKAHMAYKQNESSLPPTIFLEESGKEVEL